MKKIDTIHLTFKTGSDRAFLNKVREIKKEHLTDIGRTDTIIQWKEGGLIFHLVVRSTSRLVSPKEWTAIRKSKWKEGATWLDFSASVDTGHLGLLPSFNVSTALLVFNSMWDNNA